MKITVTTVRARGVFRRPDAHMMRMLALVMKRRTLGPGSIPTVTFLSDTGYSTGIPGYASASIQMWIRAPARVTKKARGRGMASAPVGIAPARTASWVPAVASADITTAPEILCANPPCVNIKSAGDLSEIIRKNISASAMTAPMIAKGRREDELPAVRKKITVIMAWESASTPHVYPVDLLKDAEMTDLR